MTLAKREASLRAARAYLFDAIDTAYAVVEQGDEVTMAQRADVVMATMHATSTARAVVDTVYSMSGGTAIYDAIVRAEPMLDARPRERAALVVISDGADTASDRSLRDVRSAKKRTH